MKPEELDLGVGALVAVVGLLRGQPVNEVQASARMAVTAIGPLTRELTPKINELLEKRARAKAAQAQAEAQGKPVPCPVAGCVLVAGHRTEIDPWCRDQHGTLFQEG